MKHSANGRRWSRRNIKAGRQDFFFEKKKQKTLIIQKFFWFFFSKKNGFLLYFLMCVLSPAVAQTLDQEKASQVIALMHGNPKLAEIFAMCPADAYERDAPYSASLVAPHSVSEAVCATDPMKCYRHCVDDPDAEYCFGLASAFQSNDKRIEPRYAQTLYAMACDAGMGAGCTNRASSLRNEPVRGEPLLVLPEADKDACQYRSFRIACIQDDAWGCAMLGQSYENGEGIAKDNDAATAYFKRSCDISPDFVACDFAKRRLSKLPR